MTLGIGRTTYCDKMALSTFAIEDARVEDGLNPAITLEGISQP